MNLKNVARIARVLVDHACPWPENRSANRCATIGQVLQLGGCARETQALMKLGVSPESPAVGLVHSRAVKSREISHPGFVVVDLSAPPASDVAFFAALRQTDFERLGFRMILSAGGITIFHENSERICALFQALKKPHIDFAEE